MTSPANCTCLLSLSAAAAAGGEQSCAGCPAGAFMDPLTGRCGACPEGWTSQGNTVGRFSCVCPRGAYASGGTSCEPCPLHTFSHAMGLTCTPCPKGCSTEEVGRTSLGQCHCTHNAR
jgi:hypothetical protein